MRLPFPPAGHLPLTLALALGAWAWPAPEWSAAAQTPPLQVEVGVDDIDRLEQSMEACTWPPPRGEPAIAAVLNGEPITCREVEQRAHLLLVAFSKFGARLFEQLRKGLEAQGKTGLPNLPPSFTFKSLPHDAILDWRKQALAEAVNDRLKLQAAKRLGVEVTYEGAECALSSMAERYNMTSEQFARRLEVLGVTTIREQLKAQEAWRGVIAKLMRDLDDLERRIDPKMATSKPCLRLDP